MKKWTYLTAVVLCFCTQAAAQKIIKFAALENRLNLATNDTVYVVNFWATWCAPCVKELPEFQRLNLLYRNQKFKMLLVSLDFKKDAAKLKAFVAKNQLTPEVVLLDETKYHEWIDKVDTTWGGAIPATLILKNSAGFKLFHEKSLTFDELELTIKPLL